MQNLTLTSEEASNRYVVAAHDLGFTVDAIIEGLNTHGHYHVTGEDIRDILKGIRRFPKTTYPWYNWVVRATKGQNPLRIYPWNAWSSRFILKGKAKNEANSTIFDKMRKCGYEIPGAHWVEVVLNEHLFIENELAHGCGTHDDAALQRLIIRAHNWGYTVPEIARRIPRSTPRPSRSTSKIDTDMVKKTLRSNGIPEAHHRRGRAFSVIAEEFVLCAYNLGMNVNDIRDQMYVHGFDHCDPKFIVDFLKSMGWWQGEKYQQMIPCQISQTTQPNARDGDFSREWKDAPPQSVPANQRTGRKINVVDLLN